MRHGLAAKSVIVLIIVIMCSACGSPPEGKEVIRRMGDMYAHLHSYSDTGADDIVNEGRKLTFRTVYESPGKYYFEYAEGKDDSFICAPGKKRLPVEEDDDPNDDWLADAYIFRRTESETLALELAGFTGATGATPGHVADMLFPGIGSKLNEKYPDATVVGTEQAGGVNCYVVESKTAGAKLWIDTSSYALRKFQDSLGTITIAPTLSPKVDEDVFTFKPPKGAKKSSVTFLRPSSPTQKGQNRPNIHLPASNLIGGAWYPDDESPGRGWATSRQYRADGTYISQDYVNGRVRLQIEGTWTLKGDQLELLETSDGAPGSELYTRDYTIRWMSADKMEVYNSSSGITWTVVRRRLPKPLH